MNFQLHFLTNFLSFSLSHLNIISSFILYSFFNHHLFFLCSFPTTTFFNKKCYIHNIFCNTFTKITTKSYVKVFTNSNLNPPLKLFFYSPILANNNLLLKIYYENIMVAFLISHFFYSLYYFSFQFHSYISFFFFFFLFFSTTHLYPL